MSEEQDFIVREDQAASLRTVAAEHYARWQRTACGTHSCRVIAVSGGKGGVGKTNFAVNLSLALAEAGASVLLLDADLGLANVDLLLGLTPYYNLYHVIRREVDIAHIVTEGPLGLKVLPGGAGLPDMANLGSLDIVRLLGELRQLERQHDVMVIDTAAGISNLVTQFALAADDVILVTTPEPPAMLDAYRLMKTLNASQLRGLMHLVVNMVRRSDELQQVYQTLAAVAMRYLDKPLSLLGGIPRDDAIIQCIKEHQPFLLARPNSPATRQVRYMASHFLAGMGQHSVHGTEDSFFSRLVTTMR